MSTTTEKFEASCIVELFGHQKIAGMVSEQNIAGVSMLRVDVPESKSEPAFTRFFGGSAVYSINPVDEALARQFAERLQVRPVDTYTVNDVLKKMHASLPEADGDSMF